MSYCVENFVLR